MSRIRTSPILCALLTAALLTATASRASEQGHAAADEVSQASYIDFLDTYLYTHVGDSRGPSGADLIPARDNMVSLMQGWGLTATLEPFTYSSTTYHNVVGEMIGTVYPDRVYIVGAHYDSVSNPGADDDASGVALMLECARIVSQYGSDSTIRFVAFSMEEVGLYGSYAYVDAHWTEDIRGMFQADMVAYDPGTNHANIYGRTASNPIKLAVADAVDEYGDGLTYTVGGDTPYSDHAPFEEEGFLAVLFSEGEIWNNPYYHTSQDNFENPDNLNFPYAVKMTRSAVGWLVDAAGVQVPVDGLEFSYPLGQPELVSPSGSTTLRVKIAQVGNAVIDPNSPMLHVDDGNGWQMVPLSAVAADEYEAAFPPADCLATLAYYVTASSTEPADYADPRDAPADTYSALVADSTTTIFSDTFQTDLGWSVSGDATDGQWGRGVPINCDRGDPPSDFDGSGICYLSDNDAANGCNSDIDGGTTILTSPVIDVSGGGTVSYAYWLNDVSGGPIGAEDTMTVDIATDAAGDNWANVRTYTTASGLWRTDSFTAPATATFRIRFSASDLDPGNVVEAGLDDFQVLAYVCNEPQGCAGDCNCDELRDFGDIDYFVAALGGEQAWQDFYASQNGDEAAPCDYFESCDVDGSGAVTFADIDPFVAVLGAACP